MNRITLLSIVCTGMLALPACNGDRPVVPEPTRPEVAGDPVAAAPATNAPGRSSTPSTDAGGPGDTSASDARFDGYGDMRFGMSAAEATSAWGGELTRHGTDGESCYHLSPTSARTPAEFALMIEDGRFVRYSTESDRYIAPGGGRVGMTGAQIQALYPGGIERLPHKYTEGQYLRIKDPADAARALLFETDAKGLVTEWRAGLAPQVDYVEGCS